MVAIKTMGFIVSMVILLAGGNNTNKLNNNSNMGNTEPHSSSTNMLSHFEKRFIISPHPLDPDESHMFYMHERLSNNKYILRVLSTNDSEEKQKTE